MKRTPTLIIGASVSGLASAACLHKQGIDYLLLEKEAQVATPWRTHYERLHLHTDKGLSKLPYKKFDDKILRYPSRQQVVDYLEAYQKEFAIQPLFNTEVLAVQKEGDWWVTRTTKGVFESKCVIVATGPYGTPRPINFKGAETFPGQLVHSASYQTGRTFKGQKVLVVGFGNSACEIATDLYEQGAQPSMAVRSPVNIIPRDLFGIPILRLSLLLSKLPPRVADTLNAPLMRLLFGDITRLGLKRKPYGTFEQIRREGTIPLLDSGTIKHIKQGHIILHSGIEQIKGRTVHFEDGKKEEFAAIIAAIGYNPNYADFLDVEQRRVADLRVRVNKQKLFGHDGLYFCGFWIGPTGVMREIGLDAQKIAKHIAATLQPREKGRAGSSGWFLVGVGVAVGALLGYQLTRARTRGTSSALV